MVFRKMNYSIRSLLLIPGLVLLFASCNRPTYDSIYPALSDGKYDSEFPYRNCSGQLEEMSHTLAKLDVLVFYRTHTFAKGSEVTLEMIRSSKDPAALAAVSDVYSESVGGTAICLGYTGNRLAYLTCAHVIDYPDTLITWFPGQEGKYIQALGIRARQQNTVATSPPGDELEILAHDRKADIALLGKKVDDPPGNPVPAFSYPLGESGELEWGSFVYIMGYPLGHAMITRGIVSDPDRIRKGSFLIDAVFNHGFSGGPVIAVRDGVPNFEMVGMVKSSAAINKHYLTPADPKNLEDISFNEAYTGEITVETEKDIQYGITFSVTTSALMDFYEKHRDALKEKGYDLDNFFRAASRLSKGG